MSDASRTPSINGGNDERTCALIAVVIKSLERWLMSYLKDITGPLLDLLQVKHVANRLIIDVVSLELGLGLGLRLGLGVHHTQQHA